MTMHGDTSEGRGTGGTEVRVSLACRVSTIVAGLRGKPPRGFARLEDMIGRNFVIEVLRCFALPVHSAGIVSKQPRALPEITVDLFTIARAPDVDIFHL